MRQPATPAEWALTDAAEAWLFTPGDFQSLADAAGEAIRAGVVAAALTKLASANPWAAHVESAGAGTTASHSIQQHRARVQDFSALVTAVFDELGIPIQIPLDRHTPLPFRPGRPLPISNLRLSVVRRAPKPDGFDSPDPHSTPVRPFGAPQVCIAIDDQEITGDGGR